MQLQKTRASAKPTKRELSHRELPFKKLAESRALTVAASQTPTSVAEVLSDESDAEAAPKRYETADAPGAAERRAWCDLEEAQLSSFELPARAASLAPASSSIETHSSPPEEPLSADLRATLVDLLDLHGCGLPVAWPPGFDALVARQRLAAADQF